MNAFQTFFLTVFLACPLVLFGMMLTLRPDREHQLVTFVMITSLLGAILFAFYPG